MNGIHDMGGMHGFGRVEREENEPVFHAAWEGRVLGISRACSAQRLFNIDESRHAIERMAPVDYLALELLRALARPHRATARREGRDHARGARAPHGPAGRRHRSGAAAPDPKLPRPHAARDEGADPVPPARAAAALRARRSRPHAQRRPGRPHAAAALRARQARRHRRASTAPSSSRTPTPTGRASSPTRSTACASTRARSVGRLRRAARARAPRSLGELPRAGRSRKEHVMSGDSRRPRTSSPRAGVASSRCASARSSRCWSRRGSSRATPSTASSAPTSRTSAR